MTQGSNPSLLHWQGISFFLIYLSIFGCAGSCCAGFSLVVVSGGYSSLWCLGFSLLWLLVVEHGV